MELKAIENSRVAFLADATRPVGQIFLPIAMQALLERYHFQKYPTVEELVGDVFLFNHGVFDGVGINEFGIYSDGILVASRANTDILDAFLDDLMSWARQELGIIETGVPPRERHYESALVVSLRINESRSFPFSNILCSALTRYQESYGLKPFDFSFGAFSVATDTTAYGGRKPIPFTIARRVNVPFDANVFYATAPLKTADHIALLEALESEMA